MEATGPLKGSIEKLSKNYRVTIDELHAVNRNPGNYNRITV
jgi:hypothetical protein